MSRWPDMSISQYLMDNAYKTVVIVTVSISDTREYSNRILMRYVDLGGEVSVPRLFDYRLSQENRIYFFTENEVEINVRGMPIDVLLFSPRSRPSGELYRSLRVNMRDTGNIGYLKEDRQVERDLPF